VIQTGEGSNPLLGIAGFIGRLGYKYEVEGDKRERGGREREKERQSM